MGSKVKFLGWIKRNEDSFIANCSNILENLQRSREDLENDVSILQLEINWRNHIVLTPSAVYKSILITSPAQSFY